MFRNLTQYDVIKQEQIDDIKSMGTLLRHKKSGARVLLLENNDENKVFNIAFRTPPANSTGVAHILEHSVLCGSQKFPSKDPFVELAKGSLNTFLNAMTYPDKTMYPIASCNLEDFCNLMEVYMDAVFHTNIYEKEEIFRQEGWGYILEKPEDDLIYNGVVYNEMKGAFSDPDSVLDREVMNSLFPDTPYGVESGGDPSCITDLSYEEFLEFHKRYYHPSNSYIYLYGNMDMEERLAWLDREYLSKYDVLKVDSEIALQKPFEESRELELFYPVSREEEEEENTYLAWNAVVGDASDVNLSFAMAVLEYVLLSSSGAPLKQALLDAGIGADIEGSYEGGILQPVFSVVAKYSEAERKEKFVNVLRQTLEKLVQEGIEEKAIFAGINNLEFRFREADYGQFPKGLMYGIDAFDGWLYDEEAPFVYLKQLKACDFLKAQVGTGYYEKIIRKYLLENPHVSVITMKPQQGLAAKEEEQIQEKLAAYKASLTTEQIEELIDKTKRLRLFQETPSTKEELEAIPLLNLSSIRKETTPLYNEELDVNGTPLIWHNVETNGIAYLSLMFDLGTVSKEDTEAISLLKSVLGMVNTEHYNYRELSNEIDIQSGGVYPSMSVFADTKHPGKFCSKFEMKAKVLYSQIDFAFDMIEEILLTSDFSDEKRLYELISRLKSRIQMRLTSAGHTTAANRAMAYHSNVAAYNDRTAGIAFSKYIEQLSEQFESIKIEVIEKLKKLMCQIFVSDHLMASLTSETEALDLVKQRLKRLKEKLDAISEPLEMSKHDCKFAYGKQNEGFETPGQVQYVAMAGNFRKEGFSYSGALRILKVIMGYDYLWQNIRVQGGAYGCMSGYGRTGDSYFVSYRDPNFGKTIQVYEKIAEYLRGFEVSERDMRKYIIGAISEMDTPLTPMAKGARSMNAYLCNITQEELQKERDEVLTADQEVIRGLALLVESIIQERNICVVGNEGKLAAEKELLMRRRPLVGEKE